MDSAIVKFLKMARIDIKNQGNGNDVVIKVIEGENCKFWRAEWFSKDGEGYVLETSDQHILLEIECKGEGELLLRLMGIDRRMSSGERIPLWIDYTGLTVNGKVIFKEIKSLSHDEVYGYYQHVTDGEKLHIEISLKDHEYKGDELIKLIFSCDNRPSNPLTVHCESGGERKLYEDIVDWLLISISQMKKIDYSKLEKENSDDIIQRMVIATNYLSHMIKQEESNKLLRQVVSILQNIKISLSLLMRDEKFCQQLWLYQLPFFTWNLKSIINQWVNRNEAEYSRCLRKCYLDRYESVIKKYKLVVCLHISDDIKTLEQNINSVNLIKNELKDVNLITIAESQVSATWLDKINNGTKLRILCPMEKYFFPPDMCDGEFVLDIPRGSVCSEDVANMISTMLLNGHVLYQNEQNIRLSRTINEIVPSYDL